MNKKFLIIFDFDGVIVAGSNEGYFNCYHQALKSAGIELSPAEEKKRILARWGKGHISQIKLLLKEHPKLIDQAILKYEELYQTPVFWEKIQLVKEARQTLKKLSKKFLLAIASGMQKETIKELINKFKINYFKKIISSYEITNEQFKKPHPYILNQIIKYFGSSVKKAVYVGDADSDVIMARKAKIDPIVVLTGHLNKTQAEKLKVKYIIPTIRDLPNLMARLEALAG